MNSSNLLVGVDVGGTKMALRVETVQGELVHESVLSGVEWNAEPIDRAAEMLSRTVRQHMGGCEPLQLVVGAQGVNDHSVAAALERSLQRFGLGQSVCVNDAVLLPAAAQKDSAIALVAGTGSIAVGWDREGNQLSAGGWGWVLGDDAGGAGIVREATRTALLAHDWGTPDDGLLQTLMEAFSVTSAERLSRVVNDNPDISSWSTRAPVVFDAAEAGSSSAQGVLQRATSKAVLLVRQLLSRGAAAEAVVAAGSLVQKRSVFREYLRRSLHEADLGLELVVLEVDPVVGAVALARTLSKN